VTEEGPRGPSEVGCVQRLASALSALVAVATRCGRRGYRLSGLVGTCLAVGREQHDPAVEREGVHFDVEAGARRLSRRALPPARPRRTSLGVRRSATHPCGVRATDFVKRLDVASRRPNAGTLTSRLVRSGAGIAKRCGRADAPFGSGPHSRSGVHAGRLTYSQPAQPLRCTFHAPLRTGRCIHAPAFVACDSPAFTQARPFLPSAVSNSRTV